MFSNKIEAVVAAMVLSSSLIFVGGSLYINQVDGSHLVGLQMVEGNSMNPTMEEGDIALTKYPGEISEGDVVAFRDDSICDCLISHRVVETREGGVNWYLLKGDNNEYYDGWYTDDDIVVEVVSFEGDDPFILN